MGMHFFTRDDPDGWSEYGFDWVNTGAMLEKLNFPHVSRHTGNDYMDRWSIRRYLGFHGITTAGEILEHFNQLLLTVLFQNTQESLILEFAHTDEKGDRKSWDPSAKDYMERVGRLDRFDPLGA